VANHPQALKRHRQSLVRRIRNRHYKTLAKSQVKTLRTAIEAGAKSEEIESLFRTTESTLHRIAQKGVIKPNAANRRIARLAAAVSRGATKVEEAPAAAPKKARARRAKKK